MAILSRFGVYIFGLCHPTSFQPEKKIYQTDRVESGIFGQTAKFGQPPCFFHS